MFNREYSIPFFMAVSLLMNMVIFPMDNQNNEDALFLSRLNQTITLFPQTTLRFSSSPNTSLSDGEILKKGDKKQYTAMGQSYPVSLSDQENFVMAVNKSDTQTVHELLKTNKAINVNGLNKKGNHLAYYAFLNGSVDIVNLLAAHGADFSSLKKHNEFLLSKAVWNGYTDLVPYLLKNDSTGTITDDLGKTALHVAAGKGTMPIVQLLVAHNKSLLNQPDHNGLTPVIYAAWSGHAHILKFLIDQGAMANRVDDSGKSALAAAAGKGHLDCVKIILAQPDMHLTINYADLKGSTALHWASFNGYALIVALLLAKKADVDIQDKEGFTPLARAIQNNQTQAAELLLRFGADVNKKDKAGMTPIHWAGINGNIDSADLLLKHGADVNAQDALKKRTPLIWVIRMSEGSTIFSYKSTQELEYKQSYRVKGDQVVAFVKFLLTNGAESTIRDTYDMTPLDNLLYYSDDKNYQARWFNELTQLLVDYTSKK